MRELKGIERAGAIDDTIRKVAYGESDQYGRTRATTDSVHIDVHTVANEKYLAQWLDGHGYIFRYAMIHDSVTLVPSGRC